MKIANALFILIVSLSRAVVSLTSEEYYGKLAREAPFCVDNTSPEVKKFEKIFDFYKKNPHTEVHVATTPHILDFEEDEFTQTNADGQVPIHKPPYEHKHRLLTVTFSRMNPKPVSSKQQLFTLRQWMHIHVNSLKPLVGLYVQSFSAPLGLPFGEFRTDFNCFDCMTGSNPYHIKHHKINVVPCRFRSFHSYKHPHVVVIGGKESDTETPFHDAHFHFNWAEGACQEAPLMQFMFVAVTDFTDVAKGFDAFYSQVINNTIPDSIDSVAYPFYTDFDGQMGCHGAPESSGPMWTADMIKDFVPLVAKPYKKQHSRLIYNKDYDDCVVSGGGSNQCPPGPFKCIKSDGSSMTAKEYEAMVQQRITFYNDSLQCEVCPSCFDKEANNNKPIRRTLSHQNVVYDVDGHDEYDDLERDLNFAFANGIYGMAFPGTGRQNIDKKNKTPDDITLIEEEFWLNSNQTYQMIRQIHGTLMIFGWITCPLIGFYISRFYKETGHADVGIACCNVDGWLWAHILFSYLSLASMWGAVGILMATDAPCDEGSVHDEFECFTSYHHVPGLIAMILFHLNHLTGWCRPIPPTQRTLYIYGHVIIGYGSVICAVISICFILEEISWGVRIVVILALLATIIFYVLSTVLQGRIDLKLQLEIKRTLFPIVEAIAVFENRPYGSCSSALLLIFILIQITLFLWIVVWHTRD